MRGARGAKIFDKQIFKIASNALAEMEILIVVFFIWLSFFQFLLAPLAFFLSNGVGRQSPTLQPTKRVAIGP